MTSGIVVARGGARLNGGFVTCHTSIFRLLPWPERVFESTQCGESNLVSGIFSFTAGVLLAACRSQSANGDVVMVT